MIDSSSLPDTPAELAAWLDAREQAIAAKVTTALRRIVIDAWQSWLDTQPGTVAGGWCAPIAPMYDVLHFTAAAVDLGPLDGIPQAWITFVVDELVDDLGETYLAGHMTAWVGLPFTPDEEFARQWAAVTNENAVSYLRDATNRLSHVGESVWRMLRSEVSKAVDQGIEREALKARIEDLTGWSEQRADTIARTEANGAYVQGDMAGARALGAAGPVEKVWVATRDARTRLTHRDADDQVVPFGSLFTVGGVSMDSPHDPTAPAREVVNCRCYVEFLYPGDTRPDGSVVPQHDVAGPVRLS